MRGENENKQTIHDYYVRKYNLKEPKILLYDLSEVVDINSLRRADLQLNGSKNGCNVNMDDEIPLKYLLQTESEKNGMNSMKNIRLLLSNTKPLDVDTLNDKNKRLHFKKRNIKSIIYKFIRLQHKLYKITNLKLICRKCNEICFSFECFEKHCASKHKYTLRKRNNVERNSLSNEISLNSCKSCFKSFKNYSQLRKHVKRKHNLKLNHRCEICAQNYRSRTLLKLHLHKHKLNTQIEEGTQIELSSEHRENPPVNVPERNQFLNLRIKREMSFGKEIHSKNNTVKKLKAKRSHIVYLCTLCSKTFQLESELKKHRQVLKCSFTCNECGHLFRRHYRIREHMIKYHKEFYNPIKKIRRTECGKQTRRVEKNKIIPISERIHSGIETLTKGNLKELKIIIKKTSIEECKNQTREIERNNNTTKSIDKAKSVSRKSKSSHSSRLLFNPLNKNNALKSVKDSNIPRNREMWNTDLVKEKFVMAERHVTPDNVRPRRKRICSKTDIKENLSMNNLLDNEDIVLIDKPEKSVNPIARELRERNTASKVKVEEKDNVETPIRRRSIRLSSHKAQNCNKNNEVIETVFVSKQDLPVKLTNRRKSVAESKNVSERAKPKAMKRQSTDTNLSKRVTRKSLQTNLKENATITGDTLLEHEFHSFIESERDYKEKKRKVETGLKKNSSLESNHRNTPLNEIITIKDKIVTQAVIEIEVPLFKDGNFLDLETEKIAGVKLCQTGNSGRRSDEKDVNTVILEKNICVSIPETKEQEPLFTPEEINSLIKEEPVIKEEIINFNEYIGPTTENSRHKYKCLICDRTLGNYNNALRHVGFKHFNKYPCILCPESFAEERQLKFHKEQEHTHKSITLIPDIEIKTSPHREEDTVDHLSHENESFETHSLSFIVQNEILPDILLKSSPRYEPDTEDLSEHITPFGNELLKTNLMKDFQLDVAHSKRKKSIDSKLAEHLIPLCVENSPQSKVFQIPLPITDSEIEATRRRSVDALILSERTYSPLNSSELFCNEYEDEKIQQSGQTVRPENEILHSLHACDESYFKTNYFQSATKSSESIVCSEKEMKASKLDSQSVVVSENISEKQELNERKAQLSTPSGSELVDGLQNNKVRRRSSQSTTFSDEKNKPNAKEKVSSSNGVAEKDFDLPENFYNGWFETKSIDPADEISFDNDKEVTFSEVGIEFA